MLLWIRRFGLQALVLGSLALVLAVGLVVAVTLVPGEVEDTLTRDLDDRGHSFLEVANGQVGPAMRDGRKDAAASTLQRLLAESRRGEVVGVALFPPRSDSPEGFDDRNVFARAGDLSGFAAKFAESRGHDRFEVGELIGLLHPITASVVVEGRELEKVVGQAVLVMSRGEVRSRVSQFRIHIAETFIVFGALFVAAAWMLTQMFVVRPVQRMRDVATRIAQGDLTGRAGASGPDELGLVSEALDEVTQTLAGTLGKVKQVSEGISSVMSTISRTGEVVSRGAAETQVSTSATSTSLDAMTTGMKALAGDVESLSQIAEEAGSSITEMDQVNDEVARNVSTLSGNVDETSSALEEMVFSSKEVAQNLEDLRASTDETSSSMNEMDVSISQVGSNASETSKLSELVSLDAQSGVSALQKTLAGIEKIKETNRSAAQVIDSLGRRIASIGNILTVIDDVAEQTNLLALNAAIIAAQAGEQGKGFAVVADEIKDLAERTGASTKEIAELIQGVQDESKKAIGAMERGVKSVDEGVQLGEEAQSALLKIQESSTKATQMVKAIARATVEQSRGSKQVNGAIHRIAESVQQIAKATQEQARGSEQLLKTAERMKQMTKHVERSSQEQSHGSKLITQSIERINAMVSRQHAAHKEHVRDTSQVKGATENIQRALESQNGGLRELERAIDQLRDHADVLRTELRRFKV